MKKIIMYDSDEAAEYKWIKGWVASNGWFYGKGKDAEDIARYMGCTHRKCKCGNVVAKKDWPCKDCVEQAEIERYWKSEAVEYDGKSAVYSDKLDRFFGTLKMAINEASRLGLKPSDLRLFECEVSCLPHVEDDYWECDLQDGTELPEEIRDAVNELNRIIDNHGHVALMATDRRILLEVRSDTHRRTGKRIDQT